MWLHEAGCVYRLGEFDDKGPSFSPPPWLISAQLALTASYLMRATSSFSTTLTTSHHFHLFLQWMLLLLRVEVCIDASYPGLVSCIFTGRECRHRDKAKMQQILQAEKEDNEGNQIAPRKQVRSQRAKRKKGWQQAPSTWDTDRKDEGDDAFMPTLEDCSDDESESDDDEPKIVTNVKVCILLQLTVVSLLTMF